MSGNNSDSSMQRLQQQSSSPSIPKPQSNLNIPIFNGSQMSSTQMRPGIPPSHPHSNHPPLPYSQIMASRPPSPSHSRSLSQPPVFDSLPPLSPLTYRDSSVSSLSDSTDVAMEERVVSSNIRSIVSPVSRVVGDSLPPRRGHRRSSSDNVPLGFDAMIQSSPQLIPIGSRGGVLDRSVSARENSGVVVVEKPIQLVKRESEWNKDGNSNAEGTSERKSEGEVVDDLFNAYMNLDNIDTLTSSGTEDKDFDSRASGSKTNGGESSDNEVESGVNGNYIGLHGTSSSVSTGKREGVKRSASGDIAPTARHYRSVSMDSYIGDFNFDDESPKLPPMGQHSPGNSLDGNSTKLSLDYLTGEFSEAEMKKIVANEKLAEVAVSDPKRAKRILANRLSAARSKERKMRYIVELEHKVQTLQTEATTLSAQLTILQRDSSGLTSQNNELKFRLQAMEQQAQLKDALNNTLAEEVQRLKHANAELDREVHLSNCIAQQLSINSQMFQLQHQQPNQLNAYQLQHQQSQQQERQPQHNQLQPQQQNGDTAP